MKKVFIVHGWEGSPKEARSKWLKKELESRGFQVQALQMPNPDEPKIEEWIPFLQQQVSTPNEETYFIGHSVGCQAILRYLAKLPEGTKIGGAVLIAPWIYLDEKTIEEEGPEVIEAAKPWVETEIEWEKAKTHTNNFVCIFSDNDPYVPLPNKEMLQEKLGAKIIVEHNKGHFTMENNISEVPSALNAILEMAK